MYETGYILGTLFASIVVTLLVTFVPFLIVKAVAKDSLTVKSAKIVTAVIAVFAIAVAIAIGVANGSTKFNFFPVFIWCSLGYKIIKPKPENLDSDEMKTKTQKAKEDAIAEEFMKKIDDRQAAPGQIKCPHCGNIQSEKLSRCLKCNNPIGKT